MKAVCLSVRSIKKNYENAPLLRDISFDLHKNETLCLLGPSGSGKSTLLRIIAGLEQADAGQILWQDQDITSLPVEKRNFGLMFQDYALFPHMNVAENVAFGPRMQGWKKQDIAARVDQTLHIVHMEGFATRQVGDLSGGEKQRVALARTIAAKPALLMLDEPLGALDKALRDQLGQELREILKELQLPTIYVTHDQEEAFTVGDSVAVLNFGYILQKGNPEEIYSKPASAWLSGFLGFTNHVEGKITSTDPLKVSTHLGDFELGSHDDRKPKPGEAVTLVLRPESVQPENGAGSSNSITGVIKDSQFRGDGYRLSLLLEDGEIFHFRDLQRRTIGQHIKLKIDPAAILWYGGDERTNYDHQKG